MKGWSRNKQVGTTSSLRPQDLHLVLQQEVQTPRVAGLALAWTLCTCRALGQACER